MSTETIDTSYTKEVAGTEPGIVHIVVDGEAVKRRRLELELTLRALAEKANLSPVFIWEVEEGFKGMRLETLNRLRAALSDAELQRWWASLTGFDQRELFETIETNATPSFYINCISPIRCTWFLGKKLTVRELQILKKWHRD
jgi:transcriptional regulator with XRE-family HTH domain